jgi:hypothetical protein
MNRVGVPLGIPNSCPSRESSNNRLERSRGRVFGEPRRESMFEINQLRLSLAQPRVAQPHR